MVKNYSFKYKNSKGKVFWIHKNLKGEVVWIHFKFKDRVTWVQFKFKKRVKCKLLELIKTEGCINPTVQQFLNDNGLILIKTHQSKEYKYFNIIDNKKEVERMDNKKIIKILRKEITELLDKNDEFILIIKSIGLKYFDFYIFDDSTEKYVRYKINLKNATLRKFKNDSNYYPLKSSNHEIFQNIINIYDTITR